MLLGYLDPGSGSMLVQLVALIVIWVVPALVVANYAQSKGHGFMAIFFIGLLLSWLISLLVVLFLESKRPQPESGSPPEG
jgi:hypothetical protein